MKKIKRNFTCSCGEQAVYGLDNKCIKCLISDGFFSEAGGHVMDQGIKLNDTLTLTVHSKFKNYIHRFNYLAENGYIGEGVKLVNARPDVGNGGYHFADLVIPNFSSIDFKVLQNIHGSFKGINLVIYDINRSGDTRYENISYHRTYDTVEDANRVGYGLTLMFELFKDSFKRLVKARSNHYSYAISTVSDFKYKKPYEIGEWCYKNARSNKAVMIDGTTVSLTLNRGTTYDKSLLAIGGFLIAMFTQAEVGRQEVWQPSTFSEFSEELLRRSGLRNRDTILNFVRRRVGS